MRKLHQIYAMYSENQDILKDFMSVAWGDADTGKLTMQTEELMKRLLGMKQLSTMPAFSALERELHGCLKSLGLIKELHSDAMRKRHWEQIAKITGEPNGFLPGGIDSIPCRLQCVFCILPAISAQNERSLLMPNWRI